MHRLQSASPSIFFYYYSHENIRYEEAIISLERTISFVTSVNLKTCKPFSNICEPEERWYGQPKYCYEKEMHVVTISFAVVFDIEFSFLESFL